ncbi:Mating-C domain containing protein [Pyrenophora tritici-repentis]|uniref:Retinal domain containing protein n=2 Tax=Pyrenophora tritici-repentis TaxID=45151 RepID=A0A2W1G1F3_9PLEO|nr:uncharacterized protein PTRG_01832 [Pyrenophora tritici-repentis Pt-1C-BFP]KAA8626539.1 Retinal domain-containing protein [Pyrenophora tritici-repentis]EDU41270.1 predicted protein [Pyrenophora tritici-repentis Pt-1C-BFP]KAF7454965.1 Retinal domain containing protein [Pyrenophora tritici-repentis]KAG9388725.1 Retinal domain containing protein [Pyrenophora tritici-repentis]KAI0573169.1 Retinal domain-containing protein [Pyrenophora tritici-repentis]
MADLDVLMDETLTLCKTPPVPRRHPYREFYQYRKSLPVTPSKPEMEMVGQPMFQFRAPAPAPAGELVPKPLFSRSNSLPSRATRPSLPVRPSEPFQFNADIVKSPSPLFSRRNTLPSRISRAAAAERKPSPLSRREDAHSTGPTHFAPTKHTSPADLSSKDSNTSKRRSFPARASSVPTAPKRPSPLSGKGSLRQSGGAAHIAPMQPVSPIVLSPAISHTSSAVSSPTPSVFSTADSASFSASTPSTPATSPPSTPKSGTQPQVCYFTATTWNFKTSPSPVYIPRNKLRRKDSPRFETLRTLRAKESDACLERVYGQRTSAYLAWTGFEAFTN